MACHASGPGEHVGVLALEHRRGYALHRGADFGIAWPDVAQVDVRAVRGLADGIGLQVDAHGARQGVGHHQRRRRQPIGAHLLMYATLEVAIAGEHGRHHQIAGLDGRRDRLRQRAGVADAGGAAVAHQVEADPVQVFLQAGGSQILGDHFRPRGKRGLHPRLDAQAALQGLLGDETGAQHHRRIRSVGAGGDGGDHHVAMAQVVVRARHRHASLRHVPARQFHRAVECAAQFGDVHAVLRTRFGPGQGRPDRTEIEFQPRRVDGLCRCLAPQTLRLGIGFGQRHRLLGPARQLEIADGLGVHRKEAAGGAVFRRHVGDRGAVRERQMIQAVAGELHELAHYAVRP